MPLRISGCHLVTFESYCARFGPATPLVVAAMLPSKTKPATWAAQPTGRWSSWLPPIDAKRTKAPEACTIRLPSCIAYFEEQARPAAACPRLQGRGNPCRTCSASAEGGRCPPGGTYGGSGWRRLGRAVQNRWVNSQYKRPDSRIAAGSVSTQAISRLRIVDICKPRPVGGHRAGHARREHVRGRDRQAVHIGRADGQHRHHLGRGALRVGQVRLADLLADRHHDALPADHRAQAERDGDRDLDPQRNELGRVVDLLLERLEVGLWCRRRT